MPNAGAAAVRVSVLGPLLVEANGRIVHVAGTHRRRLLALLADRAGTMASIDAIVDALWEEDPPPSALKTVQSHIVRLRHSFAAVGVDPIETTPGGYRLAAGAATTDVEAFELATVAARSHIANGAWNAAAEALASGLELWRGPAYVEFPAATFARTSAVRLEELRLGAIEDLAECRIMAGSAVGAVPSLESLVGEAPGRERAWALLMRALYASGRRHEALDAYQRARHALAEHFGLEAGPELRGLEEQMLHQDPWLVPSDGPTMLAAALRASTPLIGRDNERDALLLAWRVARSGSGQLCILRGSIDNGRTRLAAEIAGRVIGDDGTVDYIRGAEGFRETTDSAEVVDGFAERCRLRPMLLIVDDAEWSDAATVTTLTALAAAVEDLPMLAIVIVDPAAGGAAVAAIERLDPEHALTIEIGPLGDEHLASIVAADGVDPASVAAVVAVANGRPGVARREAAAWAERTASERLRSAAASSVDAIANAEVAQASVLDEVLELVAARARRDSLRSEKWAGRQPYRSLASYGPQDAEIFVGRERLVAELMARLLERRFVLVVGASGSGKSSLVRAGLIPLVRSGRLPDGQPWRTNVVVPGRDPLASLDSVNGLDDPGTQLLVVDQLEELFVGRPDVIDAYLARLVDLTEDPTLDVRVVAVIRADELVALSAVPGLMATLESAQLFVGPPTDQEARRIVEEPARRTGVAVEPALVDLVVADIAGYEAALPLVSAAMAELWQQRDAGVLRAQRYVEIGGIASSVERLGESAVARLGGDVEPLHRLVLSLAELSEDGVWTRRRRPLSEISAVELPAVAAMTDARLIVRGEATVEIVHEVVFRAWPRAVEWLAVAEGAKRIERDVSTAARAWDAEHRVDDNVYRGARLEAALEWYELSDGSPGPIVSDFLESSRARRDADELQAAQRAAMQARSNRRLRRLLVATSIFLVLALLGGGFALIQRRHAQAARDRANVQRDQAQIDRLVAESARDVDGNLDLSLLLAVEARRRTDSVATRGALLTALADNLSNLQPTRVSLEKPNPVPRLPSSFLGFLQGPGQQQATLALSGDGSILASAGTSTGPQVTVSVYDVPDRRLIKQLTAPGDQVFVDVSQDGRRVAISLGNLLEVLDIATGSITPVGVPPTTPESQRIALFDRPGTRLLVHDSANTFSWWDPSSGQPIDAAVPDPALLGGFTVDGTIVTGGPDLAARFWDGTTTKLLRTVPLQPPPVDRIPNIYVLNADASLMAGSQFAGQIYVWDMKTGTLIGNPDSRPASAQALIFDSGSPSVLLTGTAGGSIAFYDVAADRGLGSPIRVHGASIDAFAFSGDGRLMATAANDGLIALWGDNGGNGLVTAPFEASGSGTAYSADGTHLVFSPAPGRLEVRPTASVGQAGVRLQSQPLISGELSADGATVLAFTERSFMVVDATTGTPQWVGPDLFVEPNQLAAMSPDGRRVAADVNVDGVPGMTLWDSHAGATLAHVDFSTISGGRGGDFGGPPRFTADGQFIDVASSIGPLRLNARDLSLVATGTAKGIGESNLVEVPGTEEVVGEDGPGRLTRWDMSTGKVLATGLSPDISSIGSLAISPDGTLVAAYQQYTSRLVLFDVATMRPIGNPFPVGDLFFVPQFTPDGHHLVGNGALDTSVVWDLDPDDWQAAACRAAGRNLTHAEWAEFLGPDEPYRLTCPTFPAG
jgi:DNA-binding SARP family transcriptional activator/WD40 repeat protein